MSYSIEDAKEYVQENLADIMATYENYPDLPAWAKAFERTKQMWQAGGSTRQRTGGPNLRRSL